MTVTQASALQRDSGTIVITTSGTKLGSVEGPCVRNRSSLSTISNRSSTKTLMSTVSSAAQDIICGQSSSTPLPGRRESRPGILMGRIGFGGGANYKATVHCDAAARDRRKVRLF